MEEIDIRGHYARQRNGTGPCDPSDCDLCRAMVASIGRFRGYADHVMPVFESELRED